MKVIKSTLLACLTVSTMLFSLNALADNPQCTFIANDVARLKHAHQALEQAKEHEAHTLEIFREAVGDARVAKLVGGPALAAVTGPFIMVSSMTVGTAMAALTFYGSISALDGGLDFRKERPRSGEDLDMVLQGLLKVNRQAQEARAKMGSTWEFGNYVYGETELLYLKLRSEEQSIVDGMSDSFLSRLGDGLLLGRVEAQKTERIATLAQAAREVRESQFLLAERILGYSIAGCSK